MPEDLPKAVMVLVWLLIGVIVIGYLIMAFTWSSALIFALLYYGAPVLWYFYNNKRDGAHGE